MCYMICNTFKTNAPARPLPAGLLARVCDNEIRRLAADPALPDAPLFSPHVTLLGGISQPQAVIDATAVLAARLPPLTITLDRVACGATRYQCVYILCCPTAELLAAGAAARDAFGLDPSATYMPHLSLLYSDVDQARRGDVAAAAQARLFPTGGGAGTLPEAEFCADAVEVWYTPVEDKTLESWCRVAEFPLTGSSTGGGLV